MNPKLILLSLILLIGIPASSLSQQAGFDILTIGPGTQALGLNEAVTAELLGSSNLYSNPANLALEPSSNLNADYTFWIGDLALTHAGANFRKNNRAIALGFMGSQLSDIPLRGNQPGPSEGSFSMSTLSLSGGYAYRLGPLAVGASLQYLREEYYIYNSSGYAFNVGATAELWNKKIRVGSSLLNVGNMNKLRNEDTTLPTLFNSGYSAQLFTFTPPKNQDLPISVGIKNNLVIPLTSYSQTTQETESKEIYSNIALTFTVAELVTLQTGYKTGDTVRPWTAGIKITTDKISSNYAIVPFETGFGTVHSIGLSYQF